MRTLLLIFLVLGFLSGQAQQKVLPPERFSPSFRRMQNERIRPDSMNLVLSFKDQRSFVQWKSRVRVLAAYEPAGVLVCRIPSGALGLVSADTSVAFADLHRQPREELTTGTLDLTLNKLNLVHHRFPALTGAGINVSVKEQRFDTTDVDWKGRYFNSGVAAPTQSNHASIMTTTLAGGGNSSPYAKGGAPGARVTSSDFASLLPDADAVYDRYGISLQNHSYGTAIENLYAGDALAYDASSHRHPSLLHVFSSGNSGTSSSSSGNYAGIDSLANLTGSFKMAKNIITVGAVDSLNRISPYSSRGPAYDGRIKPDLVAFGEDGSSGAAALVSGAAALVQQAYRQAFNALPASALVRAVLLNGADDVGRSGPDYASGFGSLNAYRAVSALKEARFAEGTVGAGETRSFPLAVPAGISRLKVLLVWTDTPAAVNAAKALVNDLDATLSLPAIGQQWLPWVLPSRAHADSLRLLPTRKRDTLNTVEQVTLDNPQAGTYMFHVKGQQLRTAAQAFALSWQFDTAQRFQWTFPTASDVLAAGSSYVLHWQSTVATTGTLSYAVDNGPWQLIRADVPAGDQQVRWDVPARAGTVKLRLTLPSVNGVAETEPFVVSGPPDLRVGFDCPDSFLLYWNRFPGNRYTLYRLGDQYLEPLGQVTDTFTIFSKRDFPALHYAVAPKVGDRDGFRSYLVNYTTQGAGCYFQSFFASLANGNTAFLEVTLGTLYQVKELRLEKLLPAGFTTLRTVSAPAGTYHSFTDTSLVRGLNTYRMAVTLQSGEMFYSATESVAYFPDDPVIVFPNPAPQNVPVRIIAREPGLYSIIVYDAAGRIVYRSVLEDANSQIAELRLSKGLYLVKVFSDGENFVRKLVVL
ncbi:S8 family serine peptidase [Paraflavisolibacter sp. H34]|uniref:S8 family peptidase n=1 Tax=Huijunlia imazamoxiresistens TaxID=3127457 RepID=UPI00301AE4E1